MATKRRPRKHGGQFTKANNPHTRKRRRRNVPVHAAANPRRRARHRRNPPVRSRRRRRNPPSMLNAVIAGATNGAQVYIGGLAARKFAGAVQGMLPVGALPSGVGAVALRLGGAITVALVSGRVAPKYAEMLTAGAFSETIASALTQTPLAPYLGALPARRFTRHVNQLRGPGGRQLAAWPAKQGMTAPANRRLGAWPRQQTAQNV